MANYTKLPLQAIELAALYGQTSTELALKYNCKATYVKEKAASNGFQLSDMKKPSVAKFTLAMARDAFARKLHPNAVAKETGLTPHYIRMRCRHLGILLPGMQGRVYAPLPSDLPCTVPDSPITPALERLAQFDSIASAALARKKGGGANPLPVIPPGQDFPEEEEDVIDSPRHKTGAWRTYR